MNRGADPQEGVCSGSEASRGHLVARESARHIRVLGGLAWFGVALGVGAVAVALAVRPSPARRSVPDLLPTLFTIPAFSLTNQEEEEVSLESLRGQVWVADVIFTRCAGPCPKMTQIMSEIQGGLPAEARVKLITLTTDPTHDTPAVLRAYARRFGASPARWWFLTGEKRSLAHLATDGLKFAALEKGASERANAADLFIHSTCFVLVDRKGCARGVYPYSEPDMKERLLQDIGRLLREG
jgi:protein SCO1